MSFRVKIKKNIFLGVNIIPKNGFAMIMAVVISGIVLIIGFSIALVALKEVVISGAVRDSVRAYYAADSGVECARYWLVKTPSSFSSSQSSPIYCNGNSFSLGSGVIQGTESGKKTFTLQYNIDSSYKTIIKVVEELEPGLKTITSTGYNSINPSGSRAIERSRIIEAGGIGLSVGDVVLVLDNSKSIGDSQRKQTIFRNAVVDNFINNLRISESEVHFGLVTMTDPYSGSGEKGRKKASLIFPVSPYNKTSSIQFIKKYDSDHYCMEFHEGSDMAGGILKARTALSGSSRPKSIVIISDGRPNSQIDNWLSPLNPICLTSSSDPADPTFEAACYPTEYQNDHLDDRYPLPWNCPEVDSYHEYRGGDGGYSPSVNLTENQAKTAKAGNMDIIVVGWKNADCDWYDQNHTDSEGDEFSIDPEFSDNKGKCRGWLKYHIASSPDKYYPYTDIAELPEILNGLSAYFQPRVDR